VCSEDDDDDDEGDDDYDENDKGDDEDDIDDDGGEEDEEKGKGKRGRRSFFPACMMTLMKRRRLRGWPSSLRAPCSKDDAGAAADAFMTTKMRRSFLDGRGGRRGFALLLRLLRDGLQSALAFRQSVHQALLIACNDVQLVQSADDFGEFFFNAVRHGCCFLLLIFLKKVFF